MPTFTVYVTSTDLTTLNAIFNGVAMICKQTPMIWGFATMAAMYSLFSGTAKTAVAAVQGNATGILPRAGLGAFIPFVIAIILTSNQLSSRVQVESTVTGSVTVIDNVPMAISIIPAVASVLGQEVGSAVETAFQGTGTSYSSISASQNGFINPLKVLLSARSAMNRLNGIASEIDSVVSSCLGPAAAVDYASVNAMINNAGNTGADASHSIPINGANPTALGAMLYQASLNTQGYVNSLNPTSNTILTCADAAVQVANDFGDAINSSEFHRVVQGAVNGMDQLNVNDNVTFDNLTQQWNATRTANNVNNTIAIGSQQATAEVINLLAAEIVQNEQACMATSGESRTICEAALVQANEIERNNIQLAAAEVPMLKYAGSFGNLLQALIIGVGPIVAMFMMFAGVEAGKCLKTCAHLMVWPIIVTNVGAELINGLIYIEVANFAQGLASTNGMISQAQTFAMYKELSFQIGSASHMMASLPVIMGMVFALGESAALVNVGSNIAPKSSEVANDVSPQAMQQDALVKSSGVSSVTHTPENATSTMNGAMPMISASSTMGREIDKQDATFTSTDQLVKSRAAAASVAASNAKIASKSNYTELGFTKTQSDALRNAAMASAGTRTSDSTGEVATSDSSNAVQSDASASIQGGASGGSGGGGFFGQVAAAANTQAAARSSLSDAENGAHNDEAHKARETSQTLEKALNFAKTQGWGGKAVEELTKRVEAQKNYTESLTSSQTSTDLQSKALEQSADVTAYAGHITTEQVAHQAHANADFGSYMMLEGQNMNKNGAYQRNLELAKAEADNSATGNVQGDQAGRDAALSFRAAQLTAQDTHASVSDRYEAAKFVTGALSHLMHGGIGHQPMTAPTRVAGEVTNQTGGELPGAQPPAPAVRPAPTPPAHAPAHAPAHRAPAHHAPAPAPQVHPAPTPPKQPEMPETSPEAAAIAARANGIIKFAHEKGLGAKQDGTIKRTAATVVSAVKDFAHDNGSQTTYNYGEGGAAEKRQAEREAAEKAAERKRLLESARNAPPLASGD